MKKILPLLICLLCFVSQSNCINAQIDSTNRAQVDSLRITNGDVNKPDDEFNLFLYVYAAAFLTAIAVAAFIGALAALIFIGFLFVMISAGIISTSVLAGFYKKSLTTGFRTFLLILGMLTGITLGIGGLWLAIKIFKLNLSLPSSLWIGAAGGCVGGLMMGWIIFKILKTFFTYLKNKLNISLNLPA